MPNDRGVPVASTSGSGAPRAAKTARPRAPRGVPGPTAPDPARDLVLHVALRDTAPPVWRRLRVPDRLTLHQLHRVLQLAFGWLDYHLYEFTPAPPATRASTSKRGARGSQARRQVRYAEPNAE